MRTLPIIFLLLLSVPSLLWVSFYTLDIEQTNDEATEYSVSGDQSAPQIVPLPPAEVPVPHPITVADTTPPVATNQHPAGHQKHLANETAPNPATTPPQPHIPAAATAAATAKTRAKFPPVLTDMLSTGASISRGHATLSRHPGITFPAPRRQVAPPNSARRTVDSQAPAAQQIARQGTTTPAPPPRNPTTKVAPVASIGSVVGHSPAFIERANQRAANLSREYNLQPAQASRLHELILRREAPPAQPVEIEGEATPSENQAIADAAKSTDDLLRAVLPPQQADIAEAQWTERDTWWQNTLGELIDRPSPSPSGANAARQSGPTPFQNN